MAGSPRRRPVGRPQPKIQMPEPNYKKAEVQNYRNGYLVPTYGEATVRVAEITSVLDVLVLTGIVSPQEMMDLVERKCRLIDASRRQSANLDSDRG